MAQQGSTFEQLETAFRHRNFQPLYFLYGEEPFFVRQLEKLLLEHALAPHEKDFNLDILHGPEANVQDVLSRCAGYPMMAERRVVIVREFDKLTDNARFEQYASAPNPTAVVFLACSSRPNLNQKPYRALKKHAVWAEFKPLYERQLPGWIQARIEAVGYEIEPRAVQMLSEGLGTSLRTADAEIEKLITYAGGRRRITADDVIHAAGQTREYNVFELQRTIGERRYVDAVRIAERLLQQASNTRGEALSIVAILTVYFTKLWKLTAARRTSENDLAERIGVPPYFLKEYVAGARRIGRRGIDEAFSALLAADFELKGGANRDERLILTLLMRKLAGPAHHTEARATY